ncbi:T9SS type A sorting domain-containing protein [bacterium]|nr:T9SS type A sorting domain-containing protein [bacterium]
MPKGIALSGEGARYLIIVPDALYEAVLPLAEWKNQKGMQTKVVKLSETGASAYNIREYISEAYRSWEVPPEYVLLAGGFSYIPYGEVEYTSTDNYYTNVDGDLFNEIIPGRLPADNYSQMQTMVSKILHYEKEPYMDDTLWYHKAMAIVREDGDEDDDLYWSDAFLLFGFLEAEGAIEFDSLSRYTNDDDDVADGVDDGRSYIIFRGQTTTNWWTPFDYDPYTSNNGFMLPVVISPSCHLALPYDVAHDWLRAGSAANPKGGIAFCATTTTLGDAAALRSALAKGFIRTLFEDSVFTFGGACEGGRLEVYEVPDYRNESEYMGFSAVGDPELNMWTHVPKPMDVSHAPVAPFGSSNFNVNVSYEGEPVKNALVCVIMDSTVYEYGYTDLAGTIPLPIHVVSAGSLLLTVTAPNFIPYQAYINVYSEGPFVIYHDHEIDDSTGGNGDGYVNPGEIIYLKMELINYGLDTAYEVNAILNSERSGVTVLDSICYYGSIIPFDTVTTTCWYSVSVSSGLRNGDYLQLSLETYDTLDGSWISSIPQITVVTGLLEFHSYAINDLPPRGNGNGQLDPGEEIMFVVRLFNSGLSSFNDVNSILSETSDFIMVTDSSVAYGEAITGGYCINEGHPFIVHVNPDVPPGYNTEFLMCIDADGGSYEYEDTIIFSIMIPLSDSCDPTGPDEYGYWAYDDSDTSTGRAPSFYWLELDDGGGPGTILSSITDEDADTVTVELPFVFTYYGIEYETVGICSNGFLEFGSSTHRFGTPSEIPSTSRPNNALYPFWDDLDPSRAGDIYQYFDTTRNRWILEFKEVRHWSDSRQETFQLILFDPDYYPTPTGDGEIVFQYYSVGVLSNAGIGIENRTGTDGIQYVFMNDYCLGASPIEDYRAIKFTTFPPSLSEKPWIHYVAYAINDEAGGDGDGIAENGEEILISITLINHGNVNGLNTIAKLNTPSTYLDIEDSISVFGDLFIDSTRDNGTNPYMVYIDSMVPDTILYLPLNVYSNDSAYTNITYVPFQIQSTSGIGEMVLPARFEVSPNYPNPFNSMTTFTVLMGKGAAQISEVSNISFDVYDITGKHVTSRKVNPQNRSGFEILWDGTSDSGESLSSGVYFYKISWGEFSIRDKMILIK